ncbi:hypothetical protein CALCODRAFT_516971 [Calocera cornea HHB12733]|uniref:Uncharacterized protein n=1 Tax=Calocera cornea HHB12733 TaxID=1353952 RepID=A0A165GKC8_9BASI|nr:hypothetical protein CALCODRAFT_516971 [Calocera cornea HHB12733]
MAPCHSSAPTPTSPPLLAQRPERRQASSDSFLPIASTGAVFPSSAGTGDTSSQSTSYDLFGPLYPSPTDVFIWIFVLIASGLVLLTALYRVWRLRQLNRGMSTFFRTGASLQHPSSMGPSAFPPSDPRHPVHHAFYRQSQGAYPPFSYPSAPPRAHTRVQGEGIGVGGRRLDSGYDADKEELPAYERGTLPVYGEVVGYSGMRGAGADREGWEVVEMDRLGSPALAGDAHAHGGEAPPPIDAPHEAATAGQAGQGQEAGEVRPQAMGSSSNNPFRTTSPPPHPSS